MALSLRRAASPWIPVLTYHRVAPAAAGDRLDDGVVDATPADFDRQMAFVRSSFEPIGVVDLLAFAGGAQGLPRNPIMITFDDGYRDNHDVALPILLRHGVRATFFVATDYVERRRPFWWDRVALALKTSPRDGVVLRYPEPRELSLGDDCARRHAIAVVQRTIKDRPRLEVDRLVAEVEEAAGAALSSRQARDLADATVMTWDHVLALRGAGMDVQSHSRTHRVLGTLDAPELRDELVSSRAALEDVLGERVVAISYPVGRPLPAGGALRQAVTDAGYALGFTNGTGVNGRWRFDPLGIRRVSLEAGMGDAFFRAMLAVPWLAY